MPVLGKVGLVNKGAYNAGTSYTALDFVKYNGSTFVALRGVQGIAPSDDGTNWAYLAQGVDVAVANSQTVTTPGTALDAVQANRNVSGTLAKEVFDEIGSLNDALSNYVLESSVSATIPSGSNRVNSITATIPSGYKWLGWTYVATSGWIGHVYPSSNTKTSNFFTSNGTASSDRDFTAYYLVIRNV